MEFKYFSRNGEVRPIAEASVPLSNVEYSYGFGVYESIRVSAGMPYFLSDHIERLIGSAKEIDLAHPFTPELITKSIGELITKNEVDTCNLKILLIGPSTSFDKAQDKSLRAGGEATLNILCLNPLFPDKKLYRDGASCITVEYERTFPHAKTLNMLGSYLAYRKAKEAGAYDALLLDTQGRIREGTRTNFFCIKGKTLYSPKESDILLGVTRKAVLKVAAQEGFEVVERDIRMEDLASYDGAFITSTSTKIMPLRSIDTYIFGSQPSALKELMTAFDRFIDTCGGKL